VTGTYQDSDDAALLRAHVGGDREAFGELVRRHRDRLWAVALRTLGDREEAADAVQDALISAYRSADRFRGDAAVTTWLHRIVVNACLDRMRAAKVRRADPLPDDLEDRGGRGSLVTQDGTHDPADVSVAAERRRRVLDALETLPPAQRAALVLVDMEGYPVQEVAEMLGCAEGTVKSRCFRGRARLAALLGDLDPTAAEPSEGNLADDRPVPTGDQPRGPPVAG
jgi:RNA polymerase sigma-70 factor, ECF subfamily